MENISKETESGSTFLFLEKLPLVSILSLGRSGSAFSDTGALLDEGALSQEMNFPCAGIT